jgi:hypothetical protein
MHADGKGAKHSAARHYALSMFRLRSPQSGASAVAVAALAGKTADCRKTRFFSWGLRRAGFAAIFWAA